MTFSEFNFIITDLETLNLTDTPNKSIFVSLTITYMPIYLCIALNQSMFLSIYLYFSRTLLFFSLSLSHTLTHKPYLIIFPLSYYLPYIPYVSHFVPQFNVSFQIPNLQQSNESFLCEMPKLIDRKTNNYFYIETLHE